MPCRYRTDSTGWLILRHLRTAEGAKRLECLRQEFIFRERVIQMGGDANAAELGDAGAHEGHLDAKGVIKESLARIDLHGFPRFLKYLGQWNCSHGAEHRVGTRRRHLPG